MALLSHRYLFLLYILSGALLGIGFVFPVAWMLGFIGVALFIYTITKTSLLKEALLGGLIAWTVKSLFAISWFWSTYPIKWIELPLGRAEVPVVGLYWLTVSIFLGLGGALAASIWWWIKKRIQPTYGLIFFPLLWVVAEVFSSLMFSLWTLGDGGTINTVFSFGYLGYSLGFHEQLISLASFGGVYLLSFVAAGLGYLGYLLYLTFPRQKAFFIIAVMVLILWGSRGDTATLAQNNTNEATSGTTVAIIDTRFGDSFFQKENRDIYKYEQIVEAVEAALALDPDYIILPEDSRFTNTEITPELAYRMFRFQSGDSQAIMIDSGEVALPSGKSALRATIYDGISKQGFATDKQYLVPQGEFMPYFYQVSLRLLGLKKVADGIAEKLSYRPGPIASQEHFPSVLPGILFCFESASPYAVRRLLNERQVPFIAHPTSHAWFHESKILWQQQDVMLKVQALWNDVAIVSAGNMAYGALYTKAGKKIQPTPVKTGESWQVSLVRW